ncbi:acyl carrier protein [Burkholderia multivorans]|uniref:acyl carrier protein n=1 Tax=Burkholderia multivorans TaxID=87883 RepID=UPI0021C0B771|nr:acyl carrier protein [Burkholderia multivorans]MDR9052104.1 Acyl carrier protein [Burkholderia multivorans]MDR9060485.1 Acyl carrier protein [Burkholderia multivorans]MDR9066403.1 Acyl carrier protein [Burkholderia multivorans]MDR9072359.1 Acyl carrier protein [Burkholderia multivorans]MDR9078347.1 Acyl carrier protein [Burkholderia multivorans]
MSTVQQDNTEDRVKKIVADQFCIAIAEVQPDSHIVNDLQADSLDAIELVMCIEDEFGIVITDSEAEKLSTVQSIIDHVRSKV